MWHMLLVCYAAQPRLRVTQYMPAAPPTMTLSMSSWKPQKVLVPLGSSPSQPQQPSAHDASRSAPARMRYASLSLPAGAHQTAASRTLCWITCVSEVQLCYSSKTLLQACQSQHSDVLHISCFTCVSSITGNEMQFLLVMRP
jgi:hypothetical protein